MYPNFKAKLLNTTVPDWGSNPLYMGSFSSALVNLTDEMLDTIAAPIGNLYELVEKVSARITMDMFMEATSVASIQPIQYSEG